MDAGIDVRIFSDLVPLLVLWLGGSLEGLHACMHTDPPTPNAHSTCMYACIQAYFEEHRESDNGLTKVFQQRN